MIYFIIATPMKKKSTSRNYTKYLTSIADDKQIKTINPYSNLVSGKRRDQSNPQSSYQREREDDALLVKYTVKNVRISYDIFVKLYFRMILCV
jgi:hypothetical protein